MGSRISRLPSRFPVGTRYVIEGRGGHVHLRYLEFPDGRQIKLPADHVTQREPRSPKRPEQWPHQRQEVSSRVREVSASLAR